MLYCPKLPAYTSVFGPPRRIDATSGPRNSLYGSGYELLPYTASGQASPIGPASTPLPPPARPPLRALALPPNRIPAGALRPPSAFRPPPPLPRAPARPPGTFRNTRLTATGKFALSFGPCPGRVIPPFSESQAISTPVSGNSADQPRKISTKIKNRQPDTSQQE